MIPLCLIKLAGIAIGSYLAVNFEFGDNLRELFCPELYGDSLYALFFRTFLTAAAFLIASFFSGLFVFGQPLGIVLLISVGAMTGFSAASMYSEKGISAIPGILLIYLPKTAGLSITAILSVREVLRNSVSLLLSMTGTAEPPKFKSYCLRYAILFAAVFLISTADLLLNYFFRVL